MEHLVKLFTEKYLQKLKDTALTGDYEKDHKEADNILCSLLLELGFREVVNLYDEIEKRYR